jgi:hypothetical protein
MIGMNHTAFNFSQNPLSCKTYARKEEKWGYHAEAIATQSGLDHAQEYLA